MTRYEMLLKSGCGVFNVDDLMVIWKTSTRRETLESIKGYINRKKVYNVYKGIYTSQENYNKLELAQKLVTPSYITYYTALAANGVIFQQYKDIHLFAKNSKKITVNGQNYIYHKVKTQVLMSSLGLKIVDNYTLAGVERSLCDSLYINKNMAFDNLRSINVNTLSDISKIYRNKRLENDVLKMFKK